MFSRHAPNNNIVCNNIMPYKNIDDNSIEFNWFKLVPLLVIVVCTFLMILMYAVGISATVSHVSNENNLQKDKLVNNNESNNKKTQNISLMVIGYSSGIIASALTIIAIVVGVYLLMKDK